MATPHVAQPEPYFAARFPFDVQITGRHRTRKRLGKVRLGITRTGEPADLAQTQQQMSCGSAGRLVARVAVRRQAHPGNGVPPHRASDW